MIDCILVADQPRWAYHAQAKGVMGANEPKETGVKITDLLFQKDLVEENIEQLNKTDVLLIMGIYQYRGKTPFLRKLDVPVCTISHIHSFDYDRREPEPFPSWKVDVAEEVSSFGVIAGYQKKLWNKYHNIDPIYVRNGVAVDHFPPKDDYSYEKFQVGWVGNPDKDRKNFSIIKDSVEGLGEDVELRTVTSTLDEMEEDRLPNEEMWKIYHKMDVYTCMSKHEGLPTPLPEAMSCGLPIITSQCGIVDEIMSERSGFVIDISKDKLKSAILELMNSDSGRRKSMGQHNAKKIRKNWTWKDTLPSWIELVKNALSTTPPQ